MNLFIYVDTFHPDNIILICFSLWSRYLKENYFGYFIRLTLMTLVSRLCEKLVHFRGHLISFPLKANVIHIYLFFKKSKSDFLN